MPIKLNGATSGSVELNVPAAVSGGDVTLTLPNGVGSANQFLKNGSTAGTLEFASISPGVKRTYSTEVTVANGNSEVEFTGIPANVSNLRLMFQNLGCSGSNNVYVVLGHSASGGTYFTSGYESGSISLGASNNSGSFANGGMIIRVQTASQELSGIMDLYPNKTTNPDRFFNNHSFEVVTGDNVRTGSGISPDVSSVTIDRIKVIMSGSNTFNSSNGLTVTLVTEVIE